VRQLERRRDRIQTVNEKSVWVEKQGEPELEMVLK
jgi:hypothetical protein